MSACSYLILSAILQNKLDLLQLAFDLSASRAATRASCMPRKSKVNPGLGHAQLVL